MVIRIRIIIHGALPNDQHRSIVFRRKPQKIIHLQTVPVFFKIKEISQNPLGFHQIRQLIVGHIELGLIHGIYLDMHGPQQFYEAKGKACDHAVHNIIALGVQDSRQDQIVATWFVISVFTTLHGRFLPLRQAFYISRLPSPSAPHAFPVPQSCPCPGR